MTFNPDAPLAPIEGETKNSNAALGDYARMGNRSLKGLQAFYLKQEASEGSVTKPPTTKITTLENWSFTYEWQARVKRFDELEQERVVEEYAALRRQLVEDELRDYTKQLEKWVQVFERTVIHERRGRRTMELPDGSTTTVDIVELNVTDFERLAKWRAEISRQGRLALGLPDKIQQQELFGGKDDKGKSVPITIVEVVRGE